MSWVLPAIGFVLVLVQYYHHQTLAVADAEYPVMPPVAKVSVVTPAYNEENYIERALQSIQSQNIVSIYPEAFEFIVVDNESEDATAEIAAKYARVVSAPRGYVNALAKGFAEATGDIVAFVDADSIAGPNYLNLLLSHFNNPEVVAVSGNIHDTEWANPVMAVVGVYSGYLNEMLTPWIKSNQMSYYGGANAIRKDAWIALGGYDLTIDQQDRKACHKETEVEFWYKLKTIGTVIYDGRATLKVEPRMFLCQKIDCQNEQHPYCGYCEEMKAKQRF